MNQQKIPAANSSRVVKSGEEGERVAVRSKTDTQTHQRGMGETAANSGEDCRAVSQGRYQFHQIKKEKENFREDGCNFNGYMYTYIYIFLISGSSI